MDVHLDSHVAAAVHVVEDPIGAAVAYAPDVHDSLWAWLHEPIERDISKCDKETLCAAGKVAIYGKSHKDLRIRKCGGTGSRAAETEHIFLTTGFGTRFSSARRRRGAIHTALLFTFTSHGV